MVTGLFLALALAAGQPDPTSGCDGPGAALRQQAAELVEAFDLTAALTRVQQAVGAGCTDARTDAAYLSGLVALRDAVRTGGAEASLVPVREAVRELDRLAGGAPGSADVARTALLAGIAAAQTERDDMWLWIEQALTLERVQLEAGQAGAPMLTAHELAGELWLQVYRYDDARRFFARAGEEVGRTPRVTLGLARAAARLKEVVSACAEYATFLWWWGSREGAPAEVVEARQFLAQPACRSFTVGGRP